MTNFTRIAPLFLMILLFAARTTAKELPVQQSIPHQFLSNAAANEGLAFTVESDFAGAAEVWDRQTTGMVKLYIDHTGLGVPEQAYDLHVTIELRYILLSGSSGMEKHTLRVEYDPELDQAANIENALVHLGQVEQLTAEITDVTLTSANNSELPALLNAYLQLSLEEEVFVAPPPVNTTDPSIVILPPSAAVNPLITISLPEAEYADGYELQWDFIDAYALPASAFNATERIDNSDFSLKPATAVAYNFDQSATSVELSSPSYQWNALYGLGYVAFRYRYFSYTGRSKQHKRYSDWSCGAQCAGRLDPDLPAQFYAAVDKQYQHRPNLNWAYQLQFAEEGKRTEYVEYYDGLNRNRQRAAMQQSNGESVVSETIYDLHGRPVVEVLPAPTGTGELDYFSNFNRNSLEQPYSYTDLSPAVTEECATPEGQPMSDASGAANYYSLFPDYFNFHPRDQFIPNAGGYPFIQRRFDLSDESRLLRENLPGETHAFGAEDDRTTRYMYGDVSQGEIDRLFGTDVGQSQYYKKVITKDPNGQFTIAYLDNQGRTIASALLSEEPANMEPLEHPDDPEMADMRDNILANRPGNRTQSNVIEHSYPILIARENATVTITYDLAQHPLQADFCGTLPAPICYDCRYDLTIDLKDDCGGSVGGFPATRNNIQFTPDPCSETPVAVVTPGITTPPLGKGAYTLTKTLRLSQTHFDSQLEQFLDDNADCIVSIEELLEEELAILDVNPCFDPDCEALCEEQFQDAFEVIACKRSCEQSNQCDARLSLLELDVSPGGQFGLYAEDTDGSIIFPDMPHSVFNPASTFYYKNKISQTELSNAQDADGNPFDLYQASVKNIIDNWHAGWATLFMKAHPEYDCYGVCQTMEDAGDYIDAMMYVKDYQQAMDLGFFNPFPGFSSGDLPNNITVVNTTTDPYDPLYDLMDATQRANFITALKEVFPAEPDLDNRDIWEIAYAITACNQPGNANSCMNLVHSTTVYPQTQDPCETSQLWMNFRAVYLMVRQDFLEAVFDGLACQSEFANDALPGKTLRYGQPDPEEVLADNGITVPVIDPNNTTNNNEAVFKQACTDKCREKAESWVSQLSGCLEGEIPPEKSIAQVRQELVDGFMQVCECACSPEFPEGAVNCTDAGPDEFASFEEVIATVFQTAPTAVDLNCTDLLLGDVGLHDPNRQLKVENGSPAPDPCACDAYLRANNQFAAKGFASLEDYLEYLYGNSTLDARAVVCRCEEAFEDAFMATWTPGTTRDITTGEDRGKMADALSNLSAGDPRFLYVLPELTCPGCATCNQLFTPAGGEVFSLWEQAVNEAETLKTAAETDGLSASQIAQLRQTVIQNYLNRQLGLRLTYAEYADFMTTCDNLSTEGDCEYNDLVARDLEFFFSVLAEEGALYGNACLCYDVYTDPGTPGHRVYSDILAEYVETGFTRAGCDHEYRFQNRTGGTLSAIIQSYDMGSGNCPITLSRAPRQNDWDDSYLDHITRFSDLTMVPATSGNSTTFEVRAHLLIEENGLITTKQVWLRGNSCFPMGLNCTNNPDVASLCEGEMEKQDDENPDGGGCEEEKIEIATYRAIQRYNDRRQEMIDFFRQNYYAACMQPTEALYKNQGENDFPFTLYYYDRAGNLVKTVPPLGYAGYTNEDTIAAVNTTRQAGGVNRPPHTMPTAYEYNSLGQMIWQKSPDTEDLNGAGKKDRYSQRFWYNHHGQLVASQNARQARMSPQRYSYSRYDRLGRIVESGEYDGTAPAKPALNDPNFPGNVANNYYDVTETYYEQDPPDAPAVVNGLFVQGPRNLDNRVAAVLHFEQKSGGNRPLRFATYYSYDAHGNVKELWHQLAHPLTRYFHLEYHYDLISGNVKEVHYQRGQPDGFYHRYRYDADNRIAAVESSRDRIHWESDARYEYYRHGPLARAELGAQRVQGIDYAYTIQGWLKGQNSAALGGPVEMGNDGLPGLLVSNPNDLVAKDAIALQLDYFEGDYNIALSPLENPFTAATGNALDLYNGNIKSMHTGVWELLWQGQGSTVNVLPAPPLRNTAHHYSYDQLNRIQKMWLNNNQPEAGDYYTSYDYDYNGNLRALRRADEFGALMDEITYSYYTQDLHNAGATGQGNRLKNVQDPFAHSGGNDFSNTNTALSFEYDATGNLMADPFNQIDQIAWTAPGKVRSIARIAGDLQPDLRFYYDGSGQRFMKVVRPRLAGGVRSEEFWQTTLYIRDAQGNVMATYDLDISPDGTEYKEELVLKEHYIYGNDRLGMALPQQNTVVHTAKFSSSGTDSEGRYVRDNYRLVLSSGSLGGGFSSGFTFGGRPKRGTKTEVLRGQKRYELKNHLGNVLSTITDRKRPIFNVPGFSIPGLPIPNITFQHYQPEVATITEFYPFGMIQPGRSFSADEYRFGFQGQEKDDEVKGTGNSVNYTFRMHDPRLGRFMSVDPLAAALPSWSPYAFARNNPILFIDIDGQYPWSFHIRSFIATETTGGGYFKGDGRGPSLATDGSVTSRVRSTFVVDPAEATISGLAVESDPTVFFGGFVGTTFIPPDVQKGNPEASISNKSFSKGLASFDFSHSGKDPITPGFLTPALDVHANLSVEENLEEGVLTITGSFKGDEFPSTEAFITDQSGNKLFLDARRETGGLGSLFGDNKESLFNVNMQVLFDDDGNFTGVQQGDQVISVEDFNKQVQEGF